MNAGQAISLYAAENPFGSPLARAHSSYTACIDGELVRLLDWREPSARMKLTHDALRRFIDDEAYPCVGAKAAVNRQTYRLGVYPRLGSDAATAGLARDLCAFIAEQPLMQSGFTTFAAVFNDVAVADETDFERLLWRQLQMLHDLDKNYYAWDKAVSSNPEDPRFAFSFGGCAFFVIGMHPAAARKARRFQAPAIVFNAHVQFDELRAKGIYEQFVRTVRTRDTALQGSANPSSADFGAVSEARQYSGRALEEGWQCPFQP